MKKSISLDAIDQSLRTLKFKHEKLMAEYDDNYESLAVDKKLGFLTTENNQLREELKRLNDFIGYLVDIKRNSK